MADYATPAVNVSPARYATRGNPDAAALQRLYSYAKVRQVLNHYPGRPKLIGDDNG